MCKLLNVKSFGFLIENLDEKLIKNLMIAIVNKPLKLFLRIKKTEYSVIRLVGYLLEYSGTCFFQP